jgi:hypothetical protein
MQSRFRLQRTTSGYVRVPQYDSLGGNYTVLYEEQVTVPIGGALAPPASATLLSSALQASLHPTAIAYALLVNRTQGPRVVVYTNLQTFLSGPGVAPSPYHNTVLAQQGDVVSSGDGFTILTIAQWPAGSFNMTNNVNAPTIATMDAQIAGLAAGTEFLGPYAVGDAGTEQIRTRFALPLGAQLAHLCLGRELSPLEFWQSVGATIRADPILLASCNHVLNWARTALTAHDATGERRNQQPIAPDLIPLDGPLLANRMFLVKRDLPGLRPSTGDPMQQVAAAMGVFTAEAAAQRQLQQQQRVDDKKDKTPADRWRTLLPTLLRLCEVPSEVQLPVLYLEIAKGTKNTALPSFQADLDRVARLEVTYNREPPVVSPKMLRRIVDLDWAARDESALDGGLTPWHSVFVSKAQQSVLAGRAASYNLLMGSDVVSLAEVHNFEEAEKSDIALPVTFQQSKRSLEAYYLICVSGLGVHHRWTTCMRSSLQRMQRSEGDLEDKFEAHPNWCASLIRWFSLRHNHFFKQQRLALNSFDVAVPDLSTVWDELLLDDWRPPPLPVQYQRQQAPLPSPTPVPMALPMAPPVVPPAPTGGAGGRPRPEVDPRSRGTAVINLNVVPKVKEMAGSGWKSQTVQRRFLDTWPQNKDGKPMCLPYHTSGCYTNCKKVDDHREQTAAEQTSLCTFLDTNFSEFRGN